MQARESARPARGRRISVKEEDLEELYLLVQGAPYANTVLDAKASIAQNDLETTLKLIESARDRYLQSNRRVLRQEIGAPEKESKAARQQTLRLKQKQDRCKSVMEAFDDVVSILGRMIKLRAGGTGATQVTVGHRHHRAVAAARITLSRGIRNSSLGTRAISGHSAFLRCASGSVVRRYCC